MRQVLFATLCALALAGPALAEGSVKVDAATRKRIGVIVAPLAAAQRSAAVSAFARVLDPVPLATLDSDIQVAAAAAAASAAEAQRTRDLNAADATVSAKVAQAAQAQARADASKLALLRRRVSLEWGPALGALSDARRTQLINAIAAGQAALLRVDVSGLAPSGVHSVELDLGAGGVARAVVLGPARTGDPRLQSTGLLAQVSGPLAARLGAGMTLTARLAAGGPTTGVIVPRGALLRTDGKTVVYVRTAPDAFEQRAIAGLSDPAGYFANRGLAAGEVVAVQGASALLAAQAPKPETGAEDE